jgi:hypothetical protein
LTATEDDSGTLRSIMSTFDKHLKSIEDKPAESLAAINQKAAWSIAEFSALTGISTQKIRAEINQGRLPVGRVGRRLLILPETGREYLARCEVQLEVA